MRCSIPISLVVVGLLACTEAAHPPVAPLPAKVADDPAGLVEAVLLWNDVATGVVALADVPAPMPPMPESLIYAMSNGAVHDVLNAIDRRYTQHAFTGSADGPVSEAAAVGAAAHTVLAAIATGIANDPGFPNPAPLAMVEQAWADFLAGIPAGPARTAGLALGTAAGIAMLESRAGDGSAGPPLVPWVSDGTPGFYRATPPFAFDADHLTGLAAAVTWGAVRTFVVPSGATFRAGPPYGTMDHAAAVRTPRYTRDYREIVELGGAASNRTADQTDIAFFWMENSPLGWNRAARVLAEDRGLNAWDTARLFALMQYAQADAYITSLESKYHYTFWRPLTAVLFADADGNPATTADPTWDVASSVLGVPTPPVPDYPSAHATAGGAAAEILHAVFGGRTGFAMGSTSLPGKIRSFRSARDAASENAESRVFIGYHFRYATTEGLKQGAQVGRYVAHQALRRAR